MLSAQSAILSTRRALMMGSALRFGLLAGVFVAAVAGPMVGSGTGVAVTLGLIGGIWMVLSARSAKATLMSSEFPSLIARGQFEQAEDHIAGALRAFSPFGPGKLLVLHQLAVLRHAQDLHADAAALSRELLNHNLGPVKALTKSANLILAQSSIEMGDVPTATDALARLSGMSLSIGETLNLVALQLDVQSRVGAWPMMMDRYMAKVQLAEVMPAPPSAVTQALLALAAHKIGRSDVAEWLRRRAELLADPRELADRRPMLRALWPATDAPAVPGTTASDKDESTDRGIEQ